MDNNKRKRSSRNAAKVESNKKSKSSTPTPDQVQSPKPPVSAQPPQKSSSTPVPQESKPSPLPTVFSAIQHLPTVEKPQPSNLPASQWQSVEESGVMVESIDRSRKKWLSEGMFQRYWTKPLKKKGVVHEPAGNPAKESMTKVGLCTIHIEPHVFEATLYTVKDNTAKHPFQYPAQPPERPILQYGPPNGFLTPAPPGPPMQATPAQTVPRSLPPVIGAPTTSAIQTAPSSQSSTPLPQHAAPRPPPVVGHAGGPPYNPPYTAGSMRPHQNGYPASSAPPPNKSSDPVIQMLAERAATDSELKALMRIVADGKATPEELKKFQGHIDELTKLLHTRQAAAAAQAAPTRPVLPPPPIRSLPPVQQYYNTPPAQPQALRSRGPPPPPKPDISAVVFEFTGGSGDRFLFPKHSILDFHHACRCVCSFLIVRKGTEASASKYDPAIDYYQPVTIRVESAHTQPRLLECLKSVVASQEEVRRYMNEIMDQATRAEYVVLAMQLPREAGDTNGGTIGYTQYYEDTTSKNSPSRDNNNNGLLWTNVPVVVPKQKTIRFKPPLTEDEARINYIRSIAN